MKVNLNKKEFWILLVVGFIFLFLPIIMIQDWSGISFMETGPIGDTIGGTTAPFLSFFGSILVFLALKAQIDANEVIKTQFNDQRINDEKNFIYTKFKERIYLINTEIDNFEVAFHKGKMISKLEDLHSIAGKKYNFSGLQGINLFLIEYFRDFKEKDIAEINKFKFDDSFHSIMLSILNLVILFHNTHTGIKEDQILDENFRLELNELLSYTYQSKISFLVEIFHTNYSSMEKDNAFLDKIKGIVDRLRKDYLQIK